MADIVVIAILVAIGVWAIKSLRNKGSGCCHKGGQCHCTGCSRKK